MVKGTAIILTGGWLTENHAKTAHGLLRGSERFSIMAVVDQRFAGHSTADVLPGQKNSVPIFKLVDDAIRNLPQKPDYAIIGVAVHGGRMPDSFRQEVEAALRNGISVVSGLHSYLCDDPFFAELASKHNCRLIDVRKPRHVSELRFWSGEIYSVQAPCIAMLGMDCVIGKRTTAMLLMEMLKSNGIRTELIYTGQTGWMQGLKYGFIFDATVNDFISGEIERAIVECDRNENPDLILIEGQSSLRNPSGPCGSEFILSGNCKGVILQHAPGRVIFDGLEELRYPVPEVENEIELIRYFGAETIAISLNEESMEEQALEDYRIRLEISAGIPVVRPLKGNIDYLLPTIQAFMAKQKSESK